MLKIALGKRSTDRVVGSDFVSIKDNQTESVEQGLSQSRILVFCISKHTFGSNWHQLEAETLRLRDPSNKERRSLLVRLDDEPFRDCIWDITPHQKAEARLERAAVMRRLEPWDEARTDLEAVLASKYLFEGARAMALVDLADVSRKRGDHAQADILLSQAIKDPDISEETLICFLRIRMTVESACEFWRQVLATPGASDHQVSIARRRLDTIELRRD